MKRGMKRHDKIFPWQGHTMCILQAVQANVPCKCRLGLKPMYIQHVTIQSARHIAPTWLVASVFAESIMGNSTPLKITDSVCGENSPPCLRSTC
jgi:hypothetical protein